jgi:hypothetical protein
LFLILSEEQQHATVVCCCSFVSAGHVERRKNCSFLYKSLHSELMNATKSKQISKSKLDEIAEKGLRLPQTF